MDKLIVLNAYPVRDVLEKYLLVDRTRELTDKSKPKIIFATDSYSSSSGGYTEWVAIEESAVDGGLLSINLQPRVQKTQEIQDRRVKNKAEVFTPMWVCNMMNNALDEDWFCYPNVFNTPKGTTWTPRKGKITFFHVKGKMWTDYVESPRLEITCGEAPFLVSRYDTTTGEIVPIERRIGILDRKLRVVNENAKDEKEWVKYAIRAVQSVYGYEFQGDSLLIARINILATFCDYLKVKWKRDATEKELEKVAEAISWNLWQMDGLKDAVPFIKKAKIEGEQSSSESVIKGKLSPKSYDCCIKNWQGARKNGKILLFRDLKKWDEKNRNKMFKFDYVVGNPPYQDNVRGENENFAPPVYHDFMDASYAVSDKVLLIHPARFLFNLGRTPKPWNQKMLGDKHYKIVMYKQDSSYFFSNTDIKGG